MTLSAPSLIPLILFDGDFRRRKTAHQYICEDGEIKRSLETLRILQKTQADPREQTLTLFKLSKVYFCLNKLQVAMECISKVAQLQ